MCFPSGIEAGSKHDTVEAWVQEFVDFPGGSEVKNPPANLGDTEDACSIAGLGRSLGEGNGKPMQYSCLENSMDRGAWQATIHGVTKSQTLLMIHRA